jgi:hypothetical protein
MRRAIGEANRASAPSGTAANHLNERVKAGLCPAFTPYLFPLDELLVERRIDLGHLSGFAGLV